MRSGIVGRQLDRQFELLDAFLQELLADQNLAERRVRFAVLLIDLDGFLRQILSVIQVAVGELVEAFFDQRDLAVAVFLGQRSARLAFRCWCGNQGRMALRNQRFMRAQHVGLLRSVRRLGAVFNFAQGVDRRGSRHVAGCGFPRGHFLDLWLHVGRVSAVVFAAHLRRFGKDQRRRSIHAVFSQHGFDPC